MYNYHIDILGEGYD